MRDGDIVIPVRGLVARRLRRPDVRRAAPALPNGFTLGNLFFGIFAIVSASRGQFAHAVLYVVLGGVCDGFDGRIARATGTGSRFGVELDSLVDAISFGLAPAMIIYYSVLDHEGGAWWLLVFLFTACAVIRLARFNVTQAGTAKRHFQGLPSPAAGVTLATYYWFSQSALLHPNGDRGSAVARRHEDPHGCAIDLDDHKRAVPGLSQGRRAELEWGRRTRCRRGRDLRYIYLWP